MATMTNREFLKGVIEANLSDELTAFATDALAKLNSRKPSKAQLANQKANAELKVQLMQVAEVGVTYTAKALADKLGNGTSTQKVTALAKQLVALGLMTECDFKPEGKGRSVKGYTVPQEFEDVEARISPVEQEAEVEAEQETEVEVEVEEG